MKCKINLLKKMAAAALLMSAALLFAQEDSENAELQKNFVIIENRHNYNLDPHTANYSAEAQLLTGLYEGLFTYDPITLDPVYAMAKSYRISRDKKRWTFVLRDDLKYSDGVALHAEDVRASWLALLANPYAPYSSLFDIVSGAEAYRTGKAGPDQVGIYAPDEVTLTVHLNQPAAHLPKLLCMPAFSVRSQDLSLFTGPFTIAEHNPDFMILKRNENYYDLEHTKLEQITVLFSNDENENCFAYNTGKVDWLASSFDEKKLLSKDAIHLCAEFASQYFFFKFKEDSIWNNLEIRQALMEAAPWEKLRANTYVQATSLVYALNGYPKVEGYVFTDLNEAKMIMKSARKNLKLADDERLKITFAIPETEYMQKRADILREAWEPLGIDLETELYPEFDYLNHIEDSKADLFSYTWVGDFADPLAFLELFRGNSTMNVTNWKNEKFDSILDEAALYTDENHNKLLSQAEQLLLDEAVIFPIQHPVSINIINLNAVGGWAINAFDIHPLKYLFKRETKDNIPNIVMLTK